MSPRNPFTLKWLVDASPVQAAVGSPAPHTVTHLISLSPSLRVPNVMMRRGRDGGLKKEEGMTHPSQSLEPCKTNTLTNNMDNNRYFSQLSLVMYAIILVSILPVIQSDTHLTTLPSTSTSQPKNDTHYECDLCPKGSVCCGELYICCAITSSRDDAEVSITRDYA